MGLTPLHRASLFGRVGTVDMLLKLGAAIDAQDNAGDTPLDRARAGNEKYMAQHLQTKLDHMIAGRKDTG